MTIGCRLKIEKPYPNLFQSTRELQLHTLRNPVCGKRPGSQRQPNAALESVPALHTVHPYSREVYT
nr:hypothetical protein [Candidatus Freyarchaeota archaeon]